MRQAMGGRSAGRELSLRKPSGVEVVCKAVCTRIGNTMGDDGRVAIAEQCTVQEAGVPELS
jgi:hypothetical protein